MVRSGQDLFGAGQLPPELRHRSGRNPENAMTLSRLANFHSQPIWMICEIESLEDAISPTLNAVLLFQSSKHRQRGGIPLLATRELIQQVLDYQI